MPRARSPRATRKQQVDDYRHSDDKRPNIPEAGMAGVVQVPNLELRLKELITTARDLLDQDLVRPTNHRLPELWQAVRPLLEKIWSRESLKEDAEKIDNVVRAFATLDPQSMAFRYPVDTQGNRSLPGLPYINLKRVKDAIHEIAPTLDGASFAIDEWLDTKAEMRGEYGEDMQNYSEHYS